MKNHGTVSIPGWYIEFQRAVLAVLPRPPELDINLAENWSHNGESLERVFKKALIPPKDLMPPPDDEWFELEINEVSDPFSFFRDKWMGKDMNELKFNGPGLKPGKYRVKLIRLGSLAGVEEAKKLANDKGYRLFDGQAWESFKKQYPHPDGKGRIVFGGTRWEKSYGDHTSKIIIELYSAGDEWKIFFYNYESAFLSERWLVCEK